LWDLTKQDPAVSLRSLNFGGDSQHCCPPTQNVGGDSPSLSPHDLRHWSQHCFWIHILSIVIKSIRSSSEHTYNYEIPTDVMFPFLQDVQSTIYNSCYYSTSSSILSRFIHVHLSYNIMFRKNLNNFRCDLMTCFYRSHLLVSINEKPKNIQVFSFISNRCQN